MTFEKTYEVQKHNRLIIQLPERFKSKKRVKVTIEDIDDTREEKIEILKKASTDPLFLSDINEIQSDFEDSDKRRLSKKYGQITDKDVQNRVIEAICFQLGINYVQSS